MTEQPTALRLADAMQHYFDERGPDADAVASELRRLHAENEAFGVHLSERMKDLAAVEAQRDALLEALKLAWPIIEKEKFMQDGCYGKNFIQSKAERARKAYEKALAAIKQAEGENT